MSIIDNLITYITSVKIGTDHLGNRYYESRFRRDYLGVKLRYIVYKGAVEASKVPPEWHAWLHYMTNTIPDNMAKNYKWQQEALPNLTGTAYAYAPVKANKRKSVSSDYVAWHPGGSK